MTPTIGSRLRALRETLELTQEDVSARSVDQDGRILHRVEVGHVESGRNMASTRRVRAGLARAFGVAEDDLFDYLEGRIPLAQILKLRDNRRRREGMSGERAMTPQQRAIDLVVADGYGTAIEIRRAAARARETLPADKQAQLGILEWANLIEATLRQMRRAGDPAASSGVSPRGPLPGSVSQPRPKGRRSA